MSSTLPPPPEPALEPGGLLAFLRGKNQHLGEMVFEQAPVNEWPKGQP